MTASHRQLRTVFLDQGKEILDDRGCSALLHNLHVLGAQREHSDQQQKQVQQRKQRKPSFIIEGDDGDDEDRRDAYQTKLLTFAEAAAPNQYAEAFVRGLSDTEDFKSHLIRLCVHEGLLPILSTNNNTSAINVYRRFQSLHSTRHKIMRALGMQAASPLSSPRSASPAAVRITPPGSASKPSGTPGRKYRSSAAAGAGSSRLGASPAVSPLAGNKLLQSTLVPYDVETGRPLVVTACEAEATFEVGEASKRRRRNSPTRGEQQQPPAAESADHGAPLTCPHCHLGSDVPPVRKVRRVDPAVLSMTRDKQQQAQQQQQQQQQQLYKIALTALSDEEYDARWWELLSSLDLSAVRFDGQDRLRHDADVAAAIADHLESRVGAPPWHEHWTRLERLAVELRDRKVSNNEQAKLRLSQLQLEHQTLKAQVNALSVGLLEMNPLERARTLEAEQQRAGCELSSHSEASKLIEEQLRHLAELESRCLMHTGIAIEESRRAASAISDFASFVGSSRTLSSYVDVPEMAHLLGDLLSTAPIVAKDALNEAELLLYRRKNTTRSQRFQCPDCMLMCQFSRYCPQTGKLHPTIAVPGAKDEDDDHDYTTSLGAAKAALLLAQSGVFSGTTGASDTSPLAKLLLAAASLERQRDRELQMERDNRIDDGKEEVPVYVFKEEGSGKPSPSSGSAAASSSAATPSASPSPKRPVLPRHQPAPPTASSSTAAAAAAATAAQNSGGGSDCAESSAVASHPLGSFRSKMEQFRRNRDQERKSLSLTEAEAIEHGERVLAAMRENMSETPEPSATESSASPDASAAMLGTFTESQSPWSGGDDTFGNTMRLLASSIAPPRHLFASSVSSPAAIGFSTVKHEDSSASALASSAAADEMGDSSRRRSSHQLRSRSFVESVVSITCDADAEAFIKQHVHEMLQCAVRRDVEAMRWCHRRLHRIFISADNKHIPRTYADSLIELEKMFAEYFGAMVQRQKDDARLAAIGASRMSYEREGAGTSMSLRRNMLEERVRKMRREVRDLRYSIAKRPRGGRRGAEVDDDQVFEVLALRVKNLQRKKGGLRSKLRQANDEYRAIDTRIHLLRGDLLSPKTLMSQSPSATATMLQSAMSATFTM